MRDYEELVKRLREAARFSESRGYSGMANTTEEAADAIEELQAQLDNWVEQERKVLLKSVPKWISTAERQPEESGAYLCRTAKRVYLVVNYSKRHNTWNAFDSEDEPKYALEVTHWMPLPEPPEVKK